MLRISALISSLCLIAGTGLTANLADLQPQVGVREDRGTYSVTARFDVGQPAAMVLAVLSDYERIPRFMPDIRKSVIVERTPGRLVVEQEAVSRYMMFSRTIHLVLEVTEAENALHFVDRSHTSFVSYQGSWQLSPDPAGGTTITYELTAKPAFDVPGFVLKRLLKRDSGRMIEGLQREIGARGTVATAR